jgi:hypothetical protein
VSGPQVSRATPSRPMSASTLSPRWRIPGRSHRSCPVCCSPVASPRPGTGGAGRAGLSFRGHAMRIVPMWWGERSRRNLWDALVGSAVPSGPACSGGSGRMSGPEVITHSRRCRCTQGHVADDLERVGSPRVRPCRPHPSHRPPPTRPRQAPSSPRRGPSTSDGLRRRTGRPGGCWVPAHTAGKRGSPPGGRITVHVARVGQRPAACGSPEMSPIRLRRAPRSIAWQGLRTGGSRRPDPAGRPPRCAAGVALLGGGFCRGRGSPGDLPRPASPAVTDGVVRRRMRART